MRLCDYCVGEYGAEYTYTDKDGNYFIGHKSCMNRLEEMDKQIERKKAPKTGASDKGGFVK